MALQSCYECGKEISSKAIMCPQCGAPQNPVSGLIDKTKRFFAKWKEERKLRKEKEYEQGLWKTLINSLGLILGLLWFVVIFLLIFGFVMDLID
jgi:hypothetical protein